MTNGRSDAPPAPYAAPPRGPQPAEADTRRASARAPSRVGSREAGRSDSSRSSRFATAVRDTDEAQNLYGNAAVVRANGRRLQAQRNKTEEGKEREATAAALSSRTTSAEGVSTIVFDEEEIIAGKTTNVEENEKKQKEDTEGDALTGEEKAGNGFDTYEATEKANKGTEEETAASIVEGRKDEETKPENIVDEAEAQAIPPEGEVEEAEEVVGEEIIEAGTEGVDEETALSTTPAQKADKGGGTAPELAEWKAKVSGATRGINKPDLGDAASAGTRVRTAGSAASRRAAAARASVGKEAEAVIPPPPKPPDSLPSLAEDPIPNETQRIRDASEKKLPNQTLPTMVATPGGNFPKVGRDLASAYSTNVTTESEIAKAKEDAKSDKADAKGEKNPDKERAKKIKDARAKKADAEGKEGTGEPMVLVDEGPPEPPPMTKTTQTDVGKVLAVLVADPQSAAKEIVTDARRAAYPKGMLLESNYNDFEDDVLPEVQTALSTQLDNIREQAGISKEDLDKHVAERQKKTEEEGKKAIEDVGTAGQEGKEKLEEEGKTTADSIAGVRDAVAENVERKVESVSGDTDPTVIKSKRDRLIRGVTRKVTQQSIAYVQAGERREKSLGDMGKAILTGYTLAARQDEQTIYEGLLKEGKAEKDTDKEKARQDAARQTAGEKAKGSFVWLKEKLAEVSTQIGKLKTDAKTAATGFDTDVKNAGSSATAAIRDWAQKQLDEHQNFWEWIFDLFSGWKMEADEKAAVWEEVRTAEARDGIVQDLAAMDLVKQLEARKIDGKLAMGMAGLTDEQRAVIQAYYEGPAKGDSIAAVAAGLRTRLSVQRRPELVQKFETKLLGLPNDRWKDVDLIAEVQRSGGSNAYKVASEVHGAVDQWGTDEARIYQALANLTPLRAAASRKCYRAQGWGDMDADIKDELSGAELTRAQAQLSGDQALADASALREAISGLGTDENTIMQVLRNKSPEERQRIIEAYKKEYGDDFKTDLEGDLSSHDLDRANALMEGDTARADAIAIDQAMHGGLFGLGTEEKDIEGVYVQVRQEVEAQAAKEGWTTAQMEAEIKRRNGDVEKAYNTKYGTGEEGKSALREAYKDELSGPELDLALALQDNDIVAADIARIEIEKQSVVYASDETINNVLKSQGERARREVERDEKLSMQERAEIDALRGFPWSKEKWKSEHKSLDERIEKQTEERAKGYMSALETSYDEKYGTIGRGSLRLTIAMNMSGSDKAMAYDLLNQGGILRPEQEIDYAIEGAGTDEDAVKKVLAGKNKDQIQKIREAWEKKHPGENFNEAVLSEFSGRERFDIEIMLDGEPQTPQEKLTQAKKKLSYEQNAYLLGGAFSKEERKRMEAEAADLERDVTRLESLKEGTEEYERAHERYQLQSAYFEQSVENHRAAVDKVTDIAATIAGIVATVAVIALAVVATVLTGGAAGVGIAAALGAVMTNAGVAAAAAGAAALATVATKMAFKGSAYGVEEMGVDLAVGAVDALASAATAGLGGKLLAAGRLAKLSQSSKMLPRLFANAMAEGAEGFASSLPSALTGAMLDDKNWKGDPFANIAGSALVGVGMGTVLSGGLGMLGGISKPAAKAAGEAGEAGELLAEQARKHPPRETPDILAKRGTPAERLAGWQEFKSTNLGKSYNDFLHELDAGVTSRQASEEAVHQMQRKMRGELFSGIPPAERKQFAEVPIDIVSDADFERLTRSAKGQAVVLIEGGQPRVLLRESADPRVLREEGIHLLQSVDPKKAHLFKQLDESVLSKWDTLPLDEQLSLYGKKLDLEIDGQQRLIRNLEEALASAGDDAATRKQILAQIENAERTLDNLSKRFDDVADLTPQKRLDIASGKAARPDYLDQPARLFAKQDVPIVRPKRADPSAHRFEVKDCPLQNKLKPGESIHQIGDSWPEEGRFLRNGEWFDERRVYRQIEVVDVDGKVKLVREEIQMPDGSWRQRGSESTRAGKAAEEASFRYTAEKAARAKARGKEIKSIGPHSQYGSGQGFDEVYFEFDVTGKARVVIVEVKDYPGRYVPSSEFTAVIDNVEQNIDRLRKSLNDDLMRPPDKRILGLSEAQLRSALGAVRDQNISLELRLGHNTRLGTFSSGNVIKNIKRAWSQAGIRSRVPVTVTTLSKAQLNEAAADVQKVIARDFIGSRPRFYKVTSAAESLGLVKGPFRPGVGEVFVDSTGKLAALRALKEADVADIAHSTLARDIVDMLSETLKHPHSTMQAPVTVLIDVSALSPQSRKALREAIDDMVSNVHRDKQVLARLHLLTDVP